MKVLAIATHPDDETLGCGGTLLKHAAQGDALYWLIATQVFEPQWSAATREAKTQEIDQVAQAYGMQEVFKLRHPTTMLDTLPIAQIINDVREVLQQVQPEIVYLVHDGDVHTDHHVVFTATMSVLKSFYMRQFGVRRVLSYETLSSTEAAPAQYKRHFMPTVYSDISAYLERKIDILNLFATEAQPDPLPRGASAIQAQARYRGASVGTEYAEAFMLIREVL